MSDKKQLRRGVELMDSRNSQFHSVTLKSDKCKGCTNCIKHCPTQAIRVRGGKASIISELCIDCGECIRVCPHYAKKAVSDPFSVIDSFEYKIALPAPALYGQVSNLDDIDYVLTALKRIGFDDVFEVSRAAELISEASRIFMKKENIDYPVISSACPAIERLIRVRFPSLCSHVLPLHAPMELAARMAKKEAVDKTGLDISKIGVFFLTPCPAKVTDVKHPIGCKTSAVDGAIAISEIYPRLLSEMEKIEVPEQLSRSGLIGVSWAGSGGEASALLDSHYLAADGIENAIKVLEEVEDQKFGRLHFIELNACNGGCVGGVLTVKNPYVAKARIQLLRKYLPVAKNHLRTDEIPHEAQWSEPLEPATAMKLSNDRSEALKMMNCIDEIIERLPDLDCGACGAPSCQALAEDVVRGLANENDCVFRLREQVRDFARAMNILGENEGESK
jgi:iron only hydrogenase large subunit-like protein